METSPGVYSGIERSGGADDEVGPETVESLCKYSSGRSTRDTCIGEIR